MHFLYLVCSPAPGPSTLIAGSPPCSHSATEKASSRGTSSKDCLPNSTPTFLSTHILSQLSVMSQGTLLWPCGSRYPRLLPRTRRRPGRGVGETRHTSGHANGSERGEGSRRLYTFSYGLLAPGGGVVRQIEELAAPILDEFLQTATATNTATRDTSEFSPDIFVDCAF